MKNEKYTISAKQVGTYGFELCSEVYRRDRKRCSRCGARSRLHIHHIDGSGQTKNPNNSLSNLVLLCIGCHSSHHRTEFWANKAKERGGYLRKGNEKEYNKKYAARYYKLNKDKWEKYKVGKKEYMKKYRSRYGAKLSEDRKRYYAKNKK